MFLPRMVFMDGNLTEQLAPFQPNPRQMKLFESWKLLDEERQLKALFKWLGFSDADRVELATEISRAIRSGCSALPGSTGSPTRKSDAVRIRLLEVIARIGVSLQAREFFKLMWFSPRSTWPVQQKIVQMLLRSGRTPGLRMLL